MRAIADQGRLRVNERIRIPRVVVISTDGERLGEMSNVQALALARQRGLDLVEVSPESRPPVCRIMNYGKFLYEQKKKTKRGRQKGAVLKEVKFRPKIDIHDFETKMRHIREFLEKGDNVKVTIVFRRGREMMYKDKGRELAAKVKEGTKELSAVEKDLSDETFNTMCMTLVPKRGAGAKKPETTPTAAPPAEKSEKA